MSHSPHAAGAGLDDHIHKFEGQDIAYAQHRILDDLCICRVDGCQKRCQQGHQQADAAGNDEIHPYAPAHNLTAAPDIPRPEILSHKGGSRLGKGGQNEKGGKFKVQGNSRGGDILRPQIVNGNLNNDVGKGKDHALQACRQANPGNIRQHTYINGQLAQLQLHRPFLLMQPVHNQAGTAGSGNHRSDSDSLHPHMQGQHEEKIQADIDTA